MTVILPDYALAYRKAISYVKSHVQDKKLRNDFLETVQSYIKHEENPALRVNFYLEDQYKYSSSLMNSSRLFSSSQMIIKVLREYEEAYGLIEDSQRIPIHKLKSFKEIYISRMIPLDLWGIEDTVDSANNNLESKLITPEVIVVSLIIYSVKKLDKLQPLEIIRFWSEVYTFANSEDFNKGSFSNTDSILELILRTINDQAAEGDSPVSWNLLSNLV